MQLFEKAVSKDQQRLFGIVHAIQKGELSPSEGTPEARKLARTMKKKDVKDFAETKHKGLPEKKKPKQESKMNTWDKFNFLSEQVEDSNYQELFRRELAAAGHQSVEDMSDEEKRQFFNKVDAKWRTREEDILGED